MFLCVFLVLFLSFAHVIRVEFVLIIKRKRKMGLCRWMINGEKKGDICTSLPRINMSGTETEKELGMQVITFRSGDISDGIFSLKA